MPFGSVIKKKNKKIDENEIDSQKSSDFERDLWEIENM
jgi:hypothetical protein